MIDEIATFLSNCRRRMEAGEDLEILEDCPLVSPKTGKIIGRMGLGCEMYYPGGDRLEARLRSAAILRDYHGLFPRHLDQVMKGGGPSGKSQTGRIAPGSIPDLDALARAQTRSEPADDTFTFVLSAAANNDVSLYQVTTSNSDAVFTNDYSYIEAYFPFRWAKMEKFSQVVDLAVRWAGIVRPDFGLIGPAIRLAMTTANAPHVVPLLRLFPGLEYIEPVRVCVRMGAGRGKIKGMNWLTILGDSLVADLGGVSGLAEALEPSCTLHGYDGGVVVQAGPQPDFGDTNLNEIAEPYRVLGRLVDPLIFDQYGANGLFPAPTPYDSAEMTKRWLHRFAGGSMPRA